ncbi:MAG: GH36 C-terminal domain-containing protein, partial [Lachnospiraceae bacterium]|nr:GH36 C-terminal domain-containing protein [Lachnospiraceae bacterium]
LRLSGLDPDARYKFAGQVFYGDELMNLGAPLKILNKKAFATGQDFISYIEVIEAVD